MGHRITATEFVTPFYICELFTAQESHAKGSSTGEHNRTVSYCDSVSFLQKPGHNAHLMADRLSIWINSENTRSQLTINS
jgi:hypothetical protein